MVTWILVAPAKRSQASKTMSWQLPNQRGNRRRATASSPDQLGEAEEAGVLYTGGAHKLLVCPLLLVRTGIHPCSPWASFGKQTHSFWSKLYFPSFWCLWLKYALFTLPQASPIPLPYSQLHSYRLMNYYEHLNFESKERSVVTLLLAYYLAL
jgi:hypothetical protein